MMKKIIIFILSLVLLSVSVSAANNSISSCSELEGIGGSTGTCSDDYYLTQDIDCSSTSFTPRCTGGFTGTFDGDGYTISDLTISGSSYQALFYKTGTGAIIKNVNLEDVDIDGSNSYAASLVGQATNDLVIENCHVSGEVSGTNRGLVVL